MKFNRYTWQLYTQSDSGRRAMRRFAKIENSFIGNEERYFAVSTLANEEAEVDVADHVRDAIRNQNVATSRSTTDCYRQLIAAGVPLKVTDWRGRTVANSVFGRDDCNWYDYVAAVSLGLHKASPELFLPYNFRSRFHELEEIHSEFSIPMPPMPGKQQQSQRACYYLDINAAWQEFRTIQGLSPVEMCAFLYDFAPNFITPTNASDLPAATKVWMITGTTEDIAIAEAATPDTVRRWGANPNVRRGDILLLYLVSPLSAIHSIWRACSAGFVDPFFHYHTVAWMCSPMKIGNVTLATLKDDPVWSQKSAVRANFKGPSGKAAVSVEEYDGLLDILTRERHDVSKLPRLPQLPKIDLSNVTNEREVEVAIVEPFFARLGYGAKDWIRQLPVRMGRGERNYPDYAFGAITKRGDESARMIVESKYQLSSQRELVDAYQQAKSYALRLQCSIMALVAREGIWAFPMHNGQFSLERLEHKSWGALEHPDSFHTIVQLIGREKVMGGRPTRQ